MEMASFVNLQATSSHRISHDDQQSDTQTSSNSQATDVKCILIGDSTIGKTSLVVSYTTDDYPAKHIPSALDTYCVQVCADNRLVNLQICDTGGGVGSVGACLLEDVWACLHIDESRMARVWEQTTSKCPAGVRELDVASLRRLSYPGVHVVLLCFSVVKPSSFRNLRTTWLKELTTTGLLPPRLPPVDLEEHSSTRASSTKCNKRRVKASVGGKWDAASRVPPLQTPAFLLVGCACDLRNDIGHLLSLSREGESPVDKRSAEEVAHHIGAEAYVECSALTQKNLKTAFDLAIWCGLRVADSRSAVDPEPWDARSSSARLSTVSPASPRPGSQSQINGVQEDPLKQQTRKLNKPTSSLSSWRRYLCFSGNRD